MFEETHENLDALRRVFAGETSPVEAERVVAHLTGCRECWLLANRAIAAQKASGRIAVQGPLKPLIDLHDIEQARLEEWLEAQAAWTEIKSMPLKARRDKVRLTRTLHTLSFLEVLLEAGTSAAPAECEELFHLALLVSQQLASPRVSVELKNDLCAECCAEIANARRRLGKWTAARGALNKGNEYVKKGSKNGVAEGKVLCVAGALEDDSGNTEEGTSILRRAVGFFESSALIGIGAPQEALIRFNAIKALQEQFREPYIQVRRRFTAARILEQLGRMKKAETLFQAVIADELEHGLVKDFFLDLVYLFGFYLRSGRTVDAIAVCRHASDELPLLEDEEGSSEPAREQMRMVWRRLEEEVRKGNVDLGATKVLRNYVRTHWRFPASEPPSFGGRPTGETGE